MADAVNLCAAQAHLVLQVRYHTNVRSSESHLTLQLPANEMSRQNSTFCLDVTAPLLASGKAERIEKLRQNRMIDNARELATRLAALPGTLLRVQFTEFPGENHGSGVPGASRGAQPFVNAPAFP